MHPFVSVIIVNHNGRAFVDVCLRSVLANIYTPVEIIFVDNGSTDGSLQYVKDTFGSDARIRCVENNASLGPAVGRNRGARIARGKYLVFFDNDTEVDKDCIRALVQALEDDATIGSGQAKLLRMGGGDFYDCAGDYLGPLGFLIERARGAYDAGQFDVIADILSAKSAASIIRKDLFEKIGGFDEDFYMYLEETDLSFRVWLAGCRVVFIPAAKVYHAYNTPKKEFNHYYSKRLVRYYGCRNYISTLLKNLSWPNIARIVPLHTACWFILAALFLIKRDFTSGGYLLEGIWWNAAHLPRVLAKKRRINRDIRIVSDSRYLKKIMDTRTLGYYLGKGFSYVAGRPF